MSWVVEWTWRPECFSSFEGIGTTQARRRASWANWRDVQISNRMQRYDVPNLGVLKALMSPDEGRFDRMRRSTDVAYSHHLAWIRTSVLLTR